MAMPKRLIVALGLVFSGCLVSPSAHAECGGNPQCIAVSIDPAVAPFHGTPLVSLPLAFGDQSAGTTSASKTILVAAVTGPAGTFATLDAITLGGANAAEFAIGGTCTVGSPSLLHDGPACTITVTFNPTSVGAKTAAIDVQTTAITRTVPLTGSGTEFLPPSAGAASMTVQVNTPASLNLAPFITGAGITGVSIASAPAHGVATVSGTVVTYTPTRDYFGPDAFSYTATGSGGSSAPAVVTVTVAGRPDPSQNPVVRGLVSSQGATAKRFARSQISNYQRHMESLHRGERPTDAVSAGAGGSGAARIPGAGVGQPAGFVADLPPAYRPPAGSTPGSGDLPETGPAAAGSGLVPMSLLATLVSAAATRSVNLSNSSDRAGGSSGLPDGTGVWIGGNLHFGTRGETSDSSSLRFRTDGVSVGVDRRFSDALAAGVGLGYARDKTDLGGDGTNIRSSGSSIAAYASYQPTRDTYVDGLIGYGVLSLDTARFVAPANEFARAERTGTQWFGSLAAGYEHRRNGLLISPYGRLDVSNDRLKEATETGAGPNALTYFEQTLQTRQLSLGLRAESSHATRFGWALPRLRLEFKHDLESDRQATIAYADQFAGPRYSLTPVATKRNAWLTGIGSDFLLRDGLKLGIDYQYERTLGPDRSQAFRFWLVQDLDGKGFPPGLASAATFDDPVRVEAATMRDDNLNRASKSADKLADNVYSLNVGKGTAFAITRHTRLLVSAFASADKLYTYSGLDRVSGGAQAELRYRTAGDFSAPTFGIFGRAALDDYHSELRDGSRSSLGVTARQSLTDRIEVFGALARNVRRARSEVFNAMDSAARLNLDYSLGGDGTLYLGGEYRRGDTVSTGPASAESAAIARVLVQDDAYGTSPLVAYRYEAKTVLWTLGYNWSLGPRDSIDLSARRARSTPTSQPDPAGAYAATGGSGAAGTSRYTANQYSIAYLMRF